MPLPVNTRADLDALPPAERAGFLAALGGSIWRLVRDDENERWIAIEDLSTVARFGFAREDFPLAAPPALPAWTPPPDPRATMACSKLQAKLAIAALGLVADFMAWKGALDPVTNFVTIAFLEDAQTWRRLDPTFVAAMAALGKTDAEADAFFELAVTL
jgi:hypothetical protein